MAHRRQNFTDKQKAQIYCRDRATCAFSGKCLWILEEGAVSFWGSDWVDHIRPSVRGGKASIENGVCASAFYNKKKGSNTGDNAYLFKNGRPEDTYYWVHGVLDPEIADRLRRMSGLVPSDWYFNRALSNLLIGLGEEYRLHWELEPAVRTPAYWFRAARKRLEQYKKHSSMDSTMESRGLVPDDPTPDQVAMLALRSVASEAAFDRQCRQIGRVYHANATVADELWEAETDLQRERAVDKARRSRWVTPREVAALESTLPTLQTGVPRKAITIKQPWAWAIAHAGKDVENRSWVTGHRGPVAIHASTSIAKGWQDYWPRGVRRPHDDDLVTGAIVAVSDLVDVVEASTSRWYDPDSYGWVLSRVRPLQKPIPAKGSLNLWNLAPSIVRRIEAQLTAD